MHYLLIIFPTSLPPPPPLQNHSHTYVQTPAFSLVLHFTYSLIILHASRRTACRSVPANASDSLYCMLLAHNAVHGAMAGYTAFSTGLVNNRVVYIPIPRLVATSPRVMDPVGRSWERVLSMTRQPQQQATFDADVCVVNDRCMV